jgi:hypothetical protein
VSTHATVIGFMTMCFMKLSAIQSYNSIKRLLILTSRLVEGLA